MDTQLALSVSERRLSSRVAPGVWLDRVAHPFGGGQWRTMAWATFGAAADEPRPLGRSLCEARVTTCTWVMLNPSTADAFGDDPTIRRCIGFARAWGFHRTIIVNLFALRSTDPAALRTADDPIGPLNDSSIHGSVHTADLVVCAWGKHGAFMRRGEAVAKIVRDAGKAPHCLATNKDGSPVHPLYQPSTRMPVLWETAQ